MKTAAKNIDQKTYRKAESWRIFLTYFVSLSQMAFFILMNGATYIGNANFGILVAVTGLIITGSRIFDGITDPIIAVIIERYNGRFGKIRSSIVIGFIIMSIGTTLMCNIGPNLGLKKTSGLIFFILCYSIYIIGYTFLSVAANVAGNVLTNDPKQRPILSVYSTAFSYLSPILVSLILMTIVLPKFDGIKATGYFMFANPIVIAISFIGVVLSCIGIAKYDVKESYVDVNFKKDEEDKASLRDMYKLLKENKELRNYIIAAVSDKLASTVASAEVVTTMLYGIMIGSISISIILSTIGMIPSIIFAIIGAKIAGKKGNLHTLIKWTKNCIFISIVFSIFLFFAPLQEIGSLFRGKISGFAIMIAIAYVIFTFINNGAKMIVTVATGSLRMDIVDYEHCRSGRYMPALVSSTYSFVDKFVSSFGVAISTAMVGLIGYTTSAPQQGDPLTLGVKGITIFLMFIIPIIGWLATILAMKNSNLTYEQMQEVQETIADRKNKIKDKEDKEK